MSSLESILLLFTLCAFTIIKSLIQTKKLSILRKYGNYSFDSLQRLVKLYNVGIIYA